MNHHTDDLEYLSLDDEEELWPEVTVRPALMTCVGFSRDLAIDVEDVGNSLLDRATETPPHVHIRDALGRFAS